jgi:glycosyltransferase involved in cell wall biosynthesis
MRILLITQEDTLAGSSYSVFYLAKGLAERGHSVFLAARPGSFLLNLATNAPCVNLVPITLRSRFDLRAIRFLRQFTRQHGIEVVNAQSSKDRYVTILLRFFYRSNFFLFHTRRQYPLSAGGILQTWFYTAGTDKVIVISQELKRIFIRKGYHERHLMVIPNGIPAHRFSQWSESRVNELRAKFGLRNDDKVVGAVSRLKKQRQILEALKLLGRPEVKLLLVGVPKGCLDDFRQAIELPNEVIYAGVVGPEDVLNFYKLFDVSVLASTSEGFGLSLVESMAMGCPVVATDFGGIRDIVTDDANGLLFEDGNTFEMAENIGSILDSPMVRARLVYNGTATARRFDMSHTISAYESFFQSYLAAGDYPEVALR